MMLQPATSSGKLTASGQVVATECLLAGIDVIPPLTGQAIITLYDSKTSDIANAQVISELHVDAGMPTLNHEYIRSVYCNHGIYATMVESTPGSSTSFIVRYSL